MSLILFCSDPSQTGLQIPNYSVYLYFYSFFSLFILISAFCLPGYFVRACVFISWHRDNEWQEKMRDWQGMWIWTFDGVRKYWRGWNEKILIKLSPKKVGESVPAIEEEQERQTEQEKVLDRQWMWSVYCTSLFSHSCWWYAHLIRYKFIRSIFWSLSASLSSCPRHLHLQSN